MDDVNAKTLANAIQGLAGQVPVHSDLARIISRTLDVLQQPLVLDNPRFEWLDGVIVRAIQSGQWLVLDNANLCNASVLDRLNSLLERPDGFLSINEHSGRDGAPRVVRPHPDFRVFLTMDPKYGELSRAMRNRSVEIYIDLPNSTVAPFIQRIAPIEPEMRRYCEVLGLRQEWDGLDHPVFVPLALDDLSLADADRVANFAKIAGNGHQQILPEAPALQRLEAVVSYVKSPDAQLLRQAIFENYSRFTQTMATTTNAAEWDGLWRDDITKMQPLHPLQNAPALPLLAEQTGQLSHWLGICYEYYQVLYTAHRAVKAQLQKANVTKPSSLNRLQRSHISSEVAATRGDSTVKVVQFLLGVLATLHDFLRAHLSDQDQVL